jgi:Protein of unknown function (DUF1236)
LVRQGRKAVQEIKMKSCRRFAVAAALLFCSIATASAAETWASLPASDDLVLTGAQEYLLWQRLGRRSPADTTAPSGLIAAIGATVPASVTLNALPSTVTAQIPAVRLYKYATLGNKLLIINPADRVIVDVITH